MAVIRDARFCPCCRRRSPASPTSRSRTSRRSPTEFSSAEVRRRGLRRSIRRRGRQGQGRRRQRDPQHGLRRLPLRRASDRGQVGQVGHRRDELCVLHRRSRAQWADVYLGKENEGSAAIREVTGDGVDYFAVPVELGVRLATCSRSQRSPRASRSCIRSESSLSTSRLSSRTLSPISRATSPRCADGRGQADLAGRLLQRREALSIDVI